MRLIIIDGLDAVGKDTHAQLILNKYKMNGENVVIRSHPTSDNFFGIKAKKALFGKGKINKFKASIYYMMDVLRSIKKYYQKDLCDTLIMVRYLMGTAYLPDKIVKYGYGFFKNFVPTSNYMFFLDATPEVLEKRIFIRDDKEIFETLDELKNVRKKALKLAKDWYIIDTSGSVESTFNKINILLDELDGLN